ncbi:MAG TPA: glycosyltransferase family 2 protein [Verrucomicrobiota bacterium]|nr:glycosyltransferase family 2 protein [Verrucomicrobiota bacterium]
MRPNDLPPYVLVSPVRNESQFIEQTVRAVLAQSHPPTRWVIVSDGSTDGTDEIVRSYAKDAPFIELVRRDPNRPRDFASKAQAVKEGIQRLAGTPYQFVGNLDGDVSFEADYYKEVLRRFAEEPALGIAGGLLCDDCGGQWREQIVSVDFSVAGPIQMFRRECYEAIGGYLPLPFGGIDGVAEGMARMRSWKVRTFSELVVRHHRRVGTAGRSVIRACFDLGRREGVIGYHPVFELLRSGNRLRTSPLVVGGLLHYIGYLFGRLSDRPAGIPDEYIRFLRREQWDRVRHTLGGAAFD